MRLILLCLLPCLTSSLNILMYVNVIGKSHLQFAEKLISVMKTKDHQVDVIFGMLNSGVSLKGGYGARNFVPVHFPGGSSWGSSAQHLVTPFEDHHSWNPFNNAFDIFVKTNEELCDLLFDSSDAKDLVTSNSYDLALVSGYDFCPHAFMHQYKIKKVVSYAPTPACTLQNYYAGLPELPLYENMILDTRFGDRGDFYHRMVESVRTIKDRLTHPISVNSMNGKMRARFGDSFPDVRDLVKNVSLDFSNSHPLIEEPRPVSWRLRYIGGIGLPTPKKLTKEFDDMLNLSKKGTVLFSFGTQVPAEKYSEEMRREIIETFKKFPEYNFLWKLDGKSAMNASNVFNVDWLPQTDLLYDHRVVGFISHMGLNSFTETSFAGVPVVAIPLFADQIHNARRALALGTGVIVKKTEITVEKLTAALEKILYEKRYRDRALEISSMVASLPDTPQRIFLEGIEFAAKFENLSPHYRLAGADHHFLVQTGWDIAIFFTLAALLIIYASVKTVSFLLRNLPVDSISVKKTKVQ